MTKEQSDKIRKIFPEADDDLEKYDSTLINAFGRCFVVRLCEDGYSFNEWGHDAYIRTRKFSLLLSKMRQVRKMFEEMEAQKKRDKFKRKLISNLLCVRLNKLGFKTEVHEERMLEHLTIDMFFPPPLSSGSIVQIDVWAGRVQVYYMYNILYDRKEEQENIVDGAVEKIVALHKKELEELTSNQ